MSGVGYVVGRSLNEIQDQYVELLDTGVNVILFDRYYLNNAASVSDTEHDAMWQYMESMRAGQAISNNQAGYEFVDDLEDGDTLVLTRLGVLTAAAPDFWEGFMQAHSRGVHLVALDYGFNSSGEYGDSVVAMLNQMYELGRYSN